MMKKLLFILLVSFFTIVFNVGAQISNPAPLIEKHNQTAVNLLQKSRKQKTLAWVLLGVGLGTLFISSIIQTSQLGNDPLEYFLSDKSEKGAIAFLAGGAIAVASVPLFIISGKNKKKAKLIIKNKSSSFSRQIHSKANFYSVGIQITF